MNNKYNKIRTKLDGKQVMYRNSVVSTHNQILCYMQMLAKPVV